MSNSQAFVLPTMFSPNYMGINISVGLIPVNSSEVRGRTSSTEKNYSKDMSMSYTMKEWPITVFMLTQNQLTVLLLCLIR